MKYKEIANNKEINAYLQKGNANLGQLGFTDHSKAHCVQVAHQAGKILKRLGYSEHEIELAKIAGYMHDIGNAINRTHHAEYGALLANDLLKVTILVTVYSILGNVSVTQPVNQPVNNNPFFFSSQNTCSLSSNMVFLFCCRLLS